jgi:hypothetical protein
MNNLMTPQTLALIRHLLAVASGYCMAHGATRTGTFLNSEDGIALIVFIANAIWARMANSDKSLQQKAADSLPANTVLPATTDAKPLAQIMSPETATAFIRKPVSPDQQPKNSSNQIPS